MHATSMPVNVYEIVILYLIVSLVALADLFKLV